MTLPEFDDIRKIKLDDETGNMCFHCANPKCQFLSKGEMWYGQEIGYGGNGYVIYECPKFMLPSERIRNIRYNPYAQLFQCLYMDLVERNLECKLNNTYKEYCE